MIEKSLNLKDARQGGPMATVSRALSLKERQRQEREYLILQAAEDLFAEKGYYEVSLEEIAARVGIAKSTVYLHFPRKEALVLALYARDMQRLVEDVDTAITAETTSRARLEAVLKYMHGELYKKQFKVLSSLFNDAEIRKVFFQKGNRIHELWWHLSSQIISVLEEGKQSGEFDPSLPTKVLITAFFGILSSKAAEHLLPEQEISAEEFVTCIGRLYFDGIAAKRVDPNR